MRRSGLGWRRATPHRDSGTEQTRAGRGLDVPSGVPCWTPGKPERRSERLACRPMSLSIVQCGQRAYFLLDPTAARRYRSFMDPESTAPMMMAPAASATLARMQPAPRRQPPESIDEGPFRADQIREGDPYELSNGHAIRCM